MKKYFTLPLFLLVSACVTNTFLYTDEKGNPVYQVTCNGAARTYGDCLAEIGRRCPTGFNILMSQEKQTGSMTDHNISGNYNGLYSGSLDFYGNSMTMGMFNRYIIYSCKIQN